MPRKPQKPCKYGGCPNLTDKQYCADHSQVENRRYNRYQRDPQTAERYGGEWQKIREQFLKSHPLCELCQSNGRLTPADLVHHKRKLTDGGTNDWNNLQALCQFHHSWLHAEQGDRWHTSGHSVQK